jgi:GMP synthase-like glutamine amidotransferase
MKERKIYVVGSSVDYANWLQGELSSLKEADLVLFTGGQDVSSSFYNEPKHITTDSNLERDNYELSIYNQALSMNKHMLGICRGSQFLCVMAGGKLIQHQENKHYLHNIKTMDFYKEYEITSEHHQSQYHWNLIRGKDFELIAWTEGLSEYYLDGNNKELIKTIIPNNIECEIVYYPKIKCYCVQGHPEWMKKDHPTVRYLQGQVDKFLADEL